MDSIMIGDLELDLVEGFRRYIMPFESEGRTEKAAVSIRTLRYDGYEYTNSYLVTHSPKWRVERYINLDNYPEKDAYKKSIDILEDEYTENIPYWYREDRIRKLMTPYGWLRDLVNMANRRTGEYLIDPSILHKEYMAKLNYIASTCSLCGIEKENIISTYGTRWESSMNRSQYKTGCVFCDFLVDTVPADEDVQSFGVESVALIRIDMDDLR